MRCTQISLAWSLDELLATLLSHGFTSAGLDVCPHEYELWPLNAPRVRLNSIFYMLLNLSAERLTSLLRNPVLKRDKVIVASPVHLIF